MRMEDDDCTCECVPVILSRMGVKFRQTAQQLISLQVPIDETPRSDSRFRCACIAAYMYCVGDKPETAATD